MAKDVKLTDTRKDLLARVTGQKGPGGLPVPPPARAVPGIKGTPPLPVGKVVSVPTLTEQERQTLKEQAGWREGDPIPAGMANILAEVQKEMLASAQEVVLPLPEDTPPLEVRTQPLETLPASEQQRLRKAAQEMTQARMQQELARQAQAQQQAQEEAQLKKLPPDVAEAARTASQAARTARQADIPVEDDRPGPLPAAAAGGPPGGLSEGAAPAASPTGAAMGHASCPHCGWDMAMPAIPEPDYNDKMAFLQSLLGERPFLKEYELFGGAVVVVFRSLTTAELDACYRQVFAEERRGQVPTEIDRYEKINRYRTYLQLQRLRSRQFDHELPDGLSEETSPNATAYWKAEEVTIPEGETLLPHIERHILGAVLRTEMINSAVSQVCQQFNRLEARMRANSMNADFWNATGELP